MKRIEINLGGTFAEVRATLLALPSTGIEAEEICLPETADSEMREKRNCDAEVKKAFRSLYEAANGRQVETQVGFIAIAPPIAGFLKDKPYYVATQYEFFVEAFARILVAGSPPRGLRCRSSRKQKTPLAKASRRAARKRLCGRPTDHLPFTHFEIEHFDENRKCHREVGVAFRDVEPQAFANKIHADQQRKT